MTVVVEPTESQPPAAEPSGPTLAEPHRHPFAGPIRWLVAPVLVLGFGLKLVEFLLEPPHPDTAARLQWWQQHSTRLDYSQAAGLVAVLFLLIGTYYLYALVREDSRRLAAVAATLVVAAMVGLAMIHGVEQAAHWALEAHGPQAAASILDVSDVGVAGAAGFVMFLPGGILGNLLLAVALWRSRYIPTLAALLIVAFVVLDFAAEQPVVSHAAGAIQGAVLAWAVLTGYQRSAGSRRLRRAH